MYFDSTNARKFLHRKQTLEMFHTHSIALYILQLPNSYDHHRVSNTKYTHLIHQKGYVSTALALQLRRFIHGVLGRMLVVHTSVSFCVQRPTRAYVCASQTVPKRYCRACELSGTQFVMDVWFEFFVWRRRKWRVENGVGKWSLWVCFFIYVCVVFMTFPAEVVGLYFEPDCNKLYFFFFYSNFKVFGTNFFKNSYWFIK